MALKFLISCVILVLCLAHLSHSQLHHNYYAKTCPNLHKIVAAGLKAALETDPRIAASLLRLHYTDCFVDGCEASILLDDTKAFKGEKNALQNRNSVRGYEVIDHIKAEVEKSCPLTVSCSDILALAAKESVHSAGGPSWPVLLGRRDGKTASEKAANDQLPVQTASVFDNYQKFKAKGLNATDLVVLSASHTIGFARCSSFRYRLNNFNGTGKADSNMNKQLRADMQAACPDASTDNKLFPLDPASPYKFDLSYYNSLLSNGGVLESDLYMMIDRLVASWVVDYSKNQTKFFEDYAASMIRMGNVGVITAPNGQIRKNCRLAN